MRFISASHIFSGLSFLPENTVIVINDANAICDIISKNEIGLNHLELHKGIISPGFINTHCHLELSHLQNEIPQKTGIVNFALDIIKKRNTKSIESIELAMHEADAYMKTQGIVAVGDISNTNYSLEIKKKSSLYYHTFVELIGLNPSNSSLVFNNGLKLYNEFSENKLSTSFAPHAPYSSSTDLITLISNFCETILKPTSIHNQESIAENLFFETKTGDYLKLYESLGLNIDYFNATGKTSLQSILSSFNSEVNTLLVHNTFSNSADIENANQLHKKLFWCLCPNANLYIENTLPNIELLLSKNCNITLGTDSLASNSTLSIIDEINVIKQYFPGTTTETLLKMATYNGALFLGIDNQFGEIKNGKTPGLNLITEEKEKFNVTKLL